MTIADSNKEREIVKKLTVFLQQEIIKTGDRLPSERKLAEELGTSRNTLRAAFKFLQAKGVIEVRPGSGYYLISKSGLDDLSLLWDPEEENKLITDQFEAFYLFEPQAAELSATRMSVEEIKNLEETVVGLSHAVLENNIQNIVSHHKSFHEILAKGTANKAIEMMLQRFEKIYNLVASILQKISPAEKNIIFATHVNLFNAIKERDAEKARQLSEQMIFSTAGLLNKHEGIKLPESIRERHTE